MTNCSSHEKIDRLYSLLNEAIQKISKPPLEQEFSLLNYACQIIKDTFNYNDVLLAQTSLNNGYLTIIANSEGSDKKVENNIITSARRAIIENLIIFEELKKDKTIQIAIVPNKTTEPFSLLMLTANKKIIEEQSKTFLQNLAFSFSVPMLKKMYFEQNVFLSDLAARYGQCVENVFLPDYEKGYQMKVAQTAVAIVNKMKLNDKREKIANEVAIAAFLQNIGMKKLPKEIVYKNGKLSAEEMAIVKTHCQFSRELVQKMPNCPPEVVNIVSQHHEKNNGSGYPLGLTAYNITPGAKILVVAGTFVAMTSPRPHRDPIIYLAEDAIESIERDAGKLYDENVIMGLKRCHEENLLCH